MEHILKSSALLTNSEIEKIIQNPLQYFDELGIVEKFVVHHYTNGLSSYAKSVNVNLITDLNVCKLLWNEFAPKASIFDSWDFRNAFSASYRNPPLFITLNRYNEVLAVLPLEFDNIYKRFCWFGSNWNEDNTFFSKDPAFVPLLLFLAPRPLELYAISKVASDSIKKMIALDTDDSKYYLDLNNLGGISDFLVRLKKKRRYNLKRDFKYIQSLSPVVEFDGFGDYSEMVEIGKKRFGKKGEESDWVSEPDIITTFEKILLNKSPDYKVRMLSIKIGGKLAAADIIATRGGVYYTLKGSYDIDQFSGIGNYINILEIEDAISLGMKKIDFLQIDYGWKHKFFQEEKLYQFVKK